jgi:hypothetical protein
MSSVSSFERSGAERECERDLRGCIRENTASVDRRFNCRSFYRLRCRRCHLDSQGLSSVNPFTFLALVAGNAFVGISLVATHQTDVILLGLGNLCSANALIYLALKW